jgi:serine/threonine-protein kinase
MSRLTATTVALVICALVGTLPVACGGDKGQSGLTYKTWPTPPEPGQQAPAPPGAQGAPAPSAQTSPKLSFPKLNSSHGGVAVDTVGTVYVTDGTQVRMLPAGSDRSALVPPGDLKGSDVKDVKDLYGVAAVVSSSGTITIYVTDAHKLLKITPDGKVTDVSFDDLNSPVAVAVDTTSGSVYIADEKAQKVFKLTPGAAGAPPSPSELKFQGLQAPTSVAVDNKGNVYVADKGAKQLWMGSTGGEFQPLLSSPASSGNSPGVPIAVAVDGKGAVYFIDNSKKVWKLSSPTPSTQPTELHFSGLHAPTGIAVDTNGYVYVDDTDQVLKFPPS